MPIFKNSRFSFSTGERDSAGRVILHPRIPVRFADDPENRIYVVKDGDTPWTISFTFFRNIAARYRAMLYWIILEFQPGEPIVDPTRKLVPGSTLVIPSERRVVNTILQVRPREQP